MKVSLVVFFLFAIAMPSMAQRGKGGSGGGAKVSYSPRTTNNKNSNARPAANSQSQPRLKFSAGSRSVSATPRTSTQVVVVNRYVGGGCCRFWWPGGVYYGGGWYSPGWYYPGVYYSENWYWNNGWGFRFGFSPFFSAPGVKFELDEVDAKDKKAVENGIVYLGTVYRGRVKDFTGKFKSLALQPGDHDITVVLNDGRQFDVTVAVGSQHITKVGLRFAENPPQNQPAAPAGAQSQDKLTPALAPTPAK